MALNLLSLPESLYPKITEAIQDGLIWVRLSQRNWQYVVEETNECVMSVHLEYGEGDSFRFSWYTEDDCDTCYLTATEFYDAEAEALAVAEGVFLEGLYD